MYQNWPISDPMTGTGRAKKKNAGEISLTILAEVISWYYPKIETITVFTQDRDSYHYQINAHRKLKEVFDTRSPVTVSYKSNDFLLYQMYRCQMIDLEKIKNMRNRFCDRIRQKNDTASKPCFLISQEIRCFCFKLAQCKIPIFLVPASFFSIHAARFTGKSVFHCMDAFRASCKVILIALDERTFQLSFSPFLTAARIADTF